MVFFACCHLAGDLLKTIIINIFTSVFYMERFWIFQEGRIWNLDSGLESGLKIIMIFSENIPLTLS